jgi:hypothetical protein
MCFATNTTSHISRKIYQEELATRWNNFLRNPLLPEGLLPDETKTKGLNVNRPDPTVFRKFKAKRNYSKQCLKDSLTHKHWIQHKELGKY